jgi:ABC-type uncharacterized transport system permease subunit
MNLREPLLAVGAAVVAVAVVLCGLAAAGYAPGTVLATAWAGVAGSPLRLAICAQEAVPLLLCALATSLAFRAGVMNIGVEGQYLLGAVAAVGLLTNAPAGAGMPWLALLAGACAGAGWCAVAVALERGRGVPLVLSTILLNLIAVYVLGMLVQGPLHDPLTTAPQSALVPDASRLPVLVAGTGLHVGALLALGGAVALWLVQRRTVIGFEWEVIGLNATAARFAGMPVGAHQWRAALGSGAIAGLAGAMQVAGVTFFLSTDAQSSGYIGIAVALLGRLHPLGVIPAALFFSGLDLGSRQLERRLGIAHDIGTITKGLAVATVLVVGAISAHRGARR